MSGLSAAGVAVQTPPDLANGFVDIDSTLVFNYVLQPGQTISGLQQPISSDGDFYLCGMQMTSVLFQKPDEINLSGDAGMRISDDTGYRLSNDYINVSFLTPIAGNSYPWVITPQHYIRAGTRINIDLIELSNVDNVPNIIQIAFRGRYRYRLADVQAMGKRRTQIVRKRY